MDIGRRAQKIGMIYMTIAGLAAIAIGYWNSGAVAAGITAAVAVVAWLAVVILIPRMAGWWSNRPS